MQDQSASETTLPEWWYESLSVFLNELATISEQKRLWLSDGAGGKEVGSFTEACCSIFDDLTVGDLLKQRRLHGATSNKFASLMSRLSILLDSIDETLAPQDIIALQEMNSVRELALAAYIELQSIRV